MNSILRILFLVGFTLAQNGPTGSSNYWLPNMQHKGEAAFNPNASTYPIYRNVMSYGAKGDGVTDDTAAINLAISYPGYRCEGGNTTNGVSYCDSQTTTPAIVFFPPGNYLVTSAIVMIYFTQLVGDPTNLPTITVNSTFNAGTNHGTAVFDSDFYLYYQNEWYGDTNNFYRQVRNFIVDMTNAPFDTQGVHWQVGQATSLQNMVFHMMPKDEVNNTQKAIQMENGSGGWMSDLIFNGGNVGAFLGNQQYTYRNMTFNSCGTAISFYFAWVMTFDGITITDCDVGFDMSSGGFGSQTVGSVAIIDSTIGAGTGIVTWYLSGYSAPQSGGTLVLDNVDFTAAPVAIANPVGRVLLDGGQKVASYAQGNAWTTAGQDLNGETFNGTACVAQNTSQTAYQAQETTIQRLLAPIPRPSVLVDPNGNYVVRSRPQYEAYTAGEVLSAKADGGCYGDGSHDDTSCVQNFLSNAALQQKLAFFDHGGYVLTDTVVVPNNLKITGECLSIIMISGSTGNFLSQTSPQVGWQVGTAGQTGTVEMSDLVFETLGSVPGAILVEWNIKCDTSVGQASCGLWDIHWRIGGSSGTMLQSNTCEKNPDKTTTTADVAPCIGSFMLLHVTSQASIYMENTWGWVADHDLDLGTRDQIDIYNGRGFLFESENGPIWLWGTAAEHSALYDYQFSHASNVFMGVIQHETAYYQANPNAEVPFTTNPTYTDPDFSSTCTAANCPKTWGLRIINSSSIFQYGAGLYSFFENWSTACLGMNTCQEHMVDVQNSSDVYLWNLNTVGSQYLVSYMDTDIIPYSVNIGTFCDCVVLFEVAAKQ